MLGTISSSTKERELIRNETSKAIKYFEGGTVDEVQRLVTQCMAVLTVEHRYVAVDHSWPTWCQMYTGGNTFLDNVSIKAHTEQNLYECCSSDLQFPKEPTGH